VRVKRIQVNWHGFVKDVYFFNKRRSSFSWCRPRNTVYNKNVSRILKGWYQILAATCSENYQLACK